MVIEEKVYNAAVVVAMPSVRRALVASGKSEADAEDAVSFAIQRLLEQRERISAKFTEGNFSGFMYRCLLMQTKNYFMSKSVLDVKRTVSSNLPVGEADSEAELGDFFEDSRGGPEQIEARVDARRMSAELTRLTDRERTILLDGVESVSPEETAAVLNTTPFEILKERAILMSRVRSKLKVRIQ